MTASVTELYEYGYVSVLASALSSPNLRIKP